MAQDRYYEAINAIDELERLLDGMTVPSMLHVTSVENIADDMVEIEDLSVEGLFRKVGVLIGKFIRFMWKTISTTAAEVFGALSSYFGGFLQMDWEPQNGLDALERFGKIVEFDLQDNFPILAYAGTSVPTTHPPAGDKKVKIKKVMAEFLLKPEEFKSEYMNNWDKNMAVNTQTWVTYIANLHDDMNRRIDDMLDRYITFNAEAGSLGKSFTAKFGSIHKTATDDAESLIPDMDKDMKALSAKLTKEPLAGDDTWNEILLSKYGVGESKYEVPKELKGTMTLNITPTDQTVKILKERYGKIRKYKSVANNITARVRRVGKDAYYMHAGTIDASGRKAKKDDRSVDSKLLAAVKIFNTHIKTVTKEYGSSIRKAIKGLVNLTLILYRILKVCALVSKQLDKKTSAFEKTSIGISKKQKEDKEEKGDRKEKKKKGKKRESNESILLGLLGEPTDTLGEIFD